MLIFHSDGYGEKRRGRRKRKQRGWERGHLWLPADSKDVGERAEHTVQRTAWVNTLRQGSVPSEYSESLWLEIVSRKRLRYLDRRKIRVVRCSDLTMQLEAIGRIRSTAVT